MMMMIMMIEPYSLIEAREGPGGTPVGRPGIFKIVRPFFPGLRTLVIKDIQGGALKGLMKRLRVLFGP